MKSLIIMLILSNVLLFGNAQQSKANFNNPDSTFYSSLLNDFSVHSSFISISVKKKENVSQYVVDNMNLFRYFNKNLKMTEDSYKTFMLKNLIENTPIEINGKLPIYFQLVTIDSTNLKKNVNEIPEFINTYFNDLYVMKPDIDGKQQNYIVHQLFQWKIATKTDCESGFIILVKKLH